MSRPGDLDALPYTWALSSILAEICDRAGIPYSAINIDGLDGGVDGFSMTAANDAFTGIEALATIFLFDTSNYDGQLHFIPRGGGINRTVPLDDLVQDDSDPEKLTRSDAINIPKKMNLEYFDIDGGLTTNKQTSDRSLDSRSVSSAEIQTTVILRTADASRAVVINHKVSIEEQRGEFSFSLPVDYADLVNSDCIMLDGNRIRITSIEMDEGQQNYKASFDRLTAYDSDIQGVPIVAPAEPPTTIVGDTFFEFMDIPILRDADDTLGYYVAIGSESDAWQGSFVELSLDGGVTYTDSLTGTAETIMGVMMDPIGAHPVEYPDSLNTLTVHLLKDSEALESTDLAGMMNRANMALIGNEIINFSGAMESSVGVWELTGLLRGRKGTAASAHTAGERFILLDRQTLYFIQAGLVQLGRTLLFRVTSVNSSENQIYTYTFNGVGQIERAVGYLKAARDGGGNIVITWQGVGRLGGGAQAGTGLNFAGYRVDVNGTITDTPNQTLTVVDPGGAITIHVYQLNTQTGAGPVQTVTL